MNKFIIFFILLLSAVVPLHSQSITPRGHSHNDYLQKTPLMEAVNLGFGSIEIDICLTKKNELKVAHIPWFLSGKKDVEELYFAPIAKMIDEKDTVLKYSPDNPLHLLIDFKKNADSTYKYLRKVFVKYANYITQYKNDKVTHKGYLVINITGNKPWKALKNDSIWYAKIDGPLRLAKDTSDNLHGFNSIDSSYMKLMGRAATNYKELKKFRKKCSSDAEFYQLVNANMHLYHSSGITTRYYEVPNNQKSWKIIMDCGVYWVNVDKLKAFSDFYKTTLK